MTTQAADKSRLTWEQVRWNCDPKSLGFKSTKDIDPATQIIGQEEALEALEYAIESRAFGQNAFVRGLNGTGNLDLISDLLCKAGSKLDQKFDRCYVANFQQPDRPRLLTLSAGDAKYFRRRMNKFSDFITTELNKNLESDKVTEKKKALEDKANDKIKEVSTPFEEELKSKNLVMINLKTDRGVQTVISPLHEGKPVAPEQWQKMLADKVINEEQQKQISESINGYTEKLQVIGREINQIKQDVNEEIQDLLEDSTQQLLKEETKKIQKRFSVQTVTDYLQDVAEDVVEQFFYSRKEEFFPHKRYNVNILVSHDKNKDCPIIIERSPSLVKLLGSIESKWSEKGPEMSDHMSIKAGTLLRADGGFLVLDARELLGEAGAWKILTRTIKNSLLEIVPSDMSWPFAQPTLKPEPIPLNIRVILLGDSGIYYYLDNQDPDFPELFKVLADFDTELERNEVGFQNYASVVSSLVEEEGLLDFDASGVAALIEHGARICSRKNKLTTNFPRVADLAREGHYLAKKAGDKLITGDHVNQAIARTKKRAGLPSKKFQQMLANGTINVFTSGKQVGEVNGLAVIHAGPVVYGFPSRITSTIAPGRAGVINIEGQAGKSGSIHTKGFHIIGGLLRHLLPTTHPLTFSASIAFEQSYGGIDGDSASGAEFCCLISSLTGIPMNQELAMTGAIDQHGRLQAIGGVNEKIEGFYDTCQAQGFTGSQGVIIPQSNAGDLMLRKDVQESVKKGEFHVYSVDSVLDGLEIFLDQPAGVLIDEQYAEGSVLHKAVLKATEFWENTLNTGK